MLGMDRRAIIGPLAAALLAAAGCGGGGRGLPEILGEVNNEYLTTDEFLHHFKARGGIALTGKARGTLKRWLIAELVDRKLLLQEARKERIRPDRAEVRSYFQDRGRKAWGEREKEMFMDSEDDLYEQRMIEILLVQNVASPRPRSSEVAAYVKSHASEFVRPPQARLRLIVVHSAAKVKRVRAELSDGTPFGDVAREWSEEPAGDARGNASWRADSEVPSEVWEAAAAAKLERNAGPVSTPYGEFFFRVEERRPSGKLDSEEARDMAGRKLNAQKRREAIENYVASLRAAATIRVDLRALNRL